MIPGISVNLTDNLFLSDCPPPRSLPFLFDDRNMKRFGNIGLSATNHHYDLFDGRPQGQLFRTQQGVFLLTDAGRYNLVKTGHILDGRMTDVPHAGHDRSGGALFRIAKNRIGVGESQRVPRRRGARVRVDGQF